MTLVDFFISPAQASSGAAGGFDVMQFLPLVLIFVAFYFFLIRPQQKKAQQQREMVAALKKGDEVTTNGGLIGKIVKLTSEHEVLVEVGDGVEIRLLRHAILDSSSNPHSRAQTQASTGAAASNVTPLQEAKEKAEAKKSSPARKRTTKKTSPTKTTKK